MTRAWVLETVTQSGRHVSMFLGIWRVAFCTYLLFAHLDQKLIAFFRITVYATWC